MNYRFCVCLECQIGIPKCGAFNNINSEKKCETNKSFESLNQSKCEHRVMKMHTDQIYYRREFAAQCVCAHLTTACASPLTRRIHKTID